MEAEDASMLLCVFLWSEQLPEGGVSAVEVMEQQQQQPGPLIVQLHTSECQESQRHS